MLREVELAAVRRQHISLDFKSKWVTFTFLVSKNHQEGQIVKRVLQCLCDKRVCDVSCPVYTSMRLLDGMVGLGLDRACTNRKKRQVQSQLIEDWRILYGTKVSGHSGRRTGALRYIRRGWAIAQVAYLGRWRSSVIYEYAKEALESLPVNNGETFGTRYEATPSNMNPTPAIGPWKEDTENMKNYLLAELEAAKADHDRSPGSPGR